MKKVLLLAALAVATLLGLTSTASAACVNPYCPAPTAVTGPATQVTDTTAVLTGTVNSNAGGDANWAIVLTGPGGTTTIATGVAPDNAGPIAVSGVAAGLTASTAYSYVVTATGIGGQSFGAPVGFTTLATGASGGGGGTGGTGGTPSTNEKVTPTLSIKSTPTNRSSSPYRYTISGKLGEVTDDSQCTGVVQIKFSRGSSRVSTVNARVKSDCSYTRTANVRRLLTDDGSKVNVVARFEGNDSLNKAKSKTIKVGYSLS